MKRDEVKSFVWFQPFQCDGIVTWRGLPSRPATDLFAERQTALLLWKSLEKLSA
jgi:hypothetical protein